MSIILFIVILVALILVHEWGHFFAAKQTGVKVEEFGVGFPPKVFGKKMGETEYTLNALPFGGFVRIFGENIGDEERSPEDIARSFSRKPRSIQAVIVAAGVVMNLVFAWALLSLGYMAGLPAGADHEGFGEVRDIKTTIVEVVPESPASLAGILPGDRILALKTPGAEVSGGEGAGSARAFIEEHQSEEITLTLARGAEMLSVSATPQEGIAEGKAALGFALQDVGTLSLPPHEALIEGARLTYDLTVRTAEGLYAFFSGIVRGQADFSSVAGPVGLVGVVGDASQFGLAGLITLTSVISINLALINLIPFPALDGGRLVLIAIEAVRGRAISRRFVTAYSAIGFALLILLMIVVTYHDIARLFS